MKKQHHQNHTNCKQSHHHTQGLSAADAATRLLESGRNELDKEPPTPMWRIFLQQFQELLVIMLIVACIISFAAGEYASASTIVVIVMANALLGAVQEVRAGAALDALDSLSAPLCNVLRGGEVVEVESALVVPGDIIIFKLGDAIVADCRLVASSDMSSNEMVSAN